MNARAAGRFAATFGLVLVLVMGLLLVTAVSAYAVTWYDEDDPNFVYTGTWTTWTDPSPPSLGFYGPTMKYTNTAGSEVSFQFSGTAIQYRAWTGPIYGLHEVVLDGGPPEAVDLYRAGYSSIVVWSKTGLSNARHTVSIRRTSTSYLSLDAIGVEGQIPPPPLGSVTTPASSTWSIALLAFAGAAIAVGIGVAKKRLTE